jgi:predicted metal-dependent hydrolase
MVAVRHKRVQVTLMTADGPLSVPVRFTRRRGIRHLKVSVDLYNEVVVNVPARVADDHAIRFLQDQASWILDCLNRSPGTPTLVEYLEHRSLVSGLGHSWTVETLPAEAPKREVLENRHLIRLSYQEGAHEESQLLRQLQLFAEEVIPVRTAELARAKGLSYGRIMVRDQRTRWGSCSERGTLSFNWRLVMLPVALHDYIIWHELAHLTHLNHSSAFWKLLQEYDSKSQAHDAGVTEWSSLLMRLGRTPH